LGRLIERKFLKSQSQPGSIALAAAVVSLRSEKPNIFVNPNNNGISRIMEKTNVFNDVPLLTLIPLYLSKNQRDV
jgi:hypothetical protein